MVMGTNKQGEASLYTFNGLGVRVGSELILEDNTHGYTDFHCETPSVAVSATGPQGPEVVKSDYVVDYTRLNIDQRVLAKHEIGGYDFRYIYGLDKVQVKVTSEGSNWWGQNIQTCVNLGYVHTNRLGSVVNLSDSFGRVTARADYTAWGEVKAYDSITVNQGFRVLLPEITFAGHEYDDVLNQFYAKYRMYDADNKRFDAMDPVKGAIANPLTLVQYLYVVDNPIRWIDLLGLEAQRLQGSTEWLDLNPNFRAYAIDWDTIETKNYGGVTYYNARQVYQMMIYGELGGNLPNAYKDGVVTLQVSYQGVSSKIWYTSEDIRKDNKNLVKPHLSNIKDIDNQINLLLSDETTYITKTDLQAYMALVWCYDDLTLAEIAYEIIKQKEYAVVDGIAFSVSGGWGIAASGQMLVLHDTLGNNGLSSSFGIGAGIGVSIPSIGGLAAATLSSLSIGGMYIKFDKCRDIWDVEGLGVSVSGTAGIFTVGLNIGHNSIGELTTGSVGGITQRGLSFAVTIGNTVIQWTW